MAKDIVNWVDISDKFDKDGWVDTTYRNGYNFIDVFSGAGGLSCGLVQAGFTPVANIEIMPDAVATYAYNFITQKGFEEKIEAQDIREDSVKIELYNQIADKHIHVIAGGFPCQGFSMSGKRVVTDPRNSLYKEMLSIVTHIRPEFVIMENVLGLRSMLGGKVEQQIIEDYKNIGYNINVTVLNSADYGVAQTRSRVIFIGNRINKPNYHPQPLFNSATYKTVGEEIERFMTIPENPAINHVFTKHTQNMVNRLSRLAEGESLYPDYTESWRRLYWDRPAFTIKESHGAGNVHPKLPRVLTAREMAALQSFPDDFIFQGAKKWQLVQIGNAVPPLLGKAIGVAVQKALES